MIRNIFSNGAADFIEKNTWRDAQRIARAIKNEVEYQGAKKLIAKAS